MLCLTRAGRPCTLGRSAKLQLSGMRPDLSAGSDKPPHFFCQGISLVTPASGSNLPRRHRGGLEALEISPSPETLPLRMLAKMAESERHGAATLVRIFHQAFKNFRSDFPDTANRRIGQSAFF